MGQEEFSMAVGDNETFNFVEAEHKVLDFWKANQIFKKSLEKTKNASPYIFYDGPPFATGLPHHGHLVGNILKDCVPRYFTMKGRYVERRFGWDCHGVPIEHEIDKKLGMNASQAVEKLGVKGYNEQCRGIVDRYTAEWEKIVTRIGRWVDFENDYKTMDTSFMESVWWVFKQLWDKNLIYQGTKVVPFSYALGTVLSNFEASSNYQSVQDPAITILFKLSDLDEYMMAWTTTPWTLPSNLALCVRNDITYVKVRDEEISKVFYLAKERLAAYEKKHKLVILNEVLGSELVGKKYEPLFPYFKHLKDEACFQIISDQYVTTEDGTGVVHIAPAFGEDDNRVMREHGIMSVVCPVDDNGNFTKEVTDWAGQLVKDTDKHIIRALKEQGNLYDQSVIVHNYPYCPRSDTPLIYKAIPSWYVKVEQIKQKLIDSNKQIHWVPDHIKEGRFGNWLEGARDWAISRNRVWGTPLPIWKNETSGHFICMGSIEELKKYSSVELTDLHREYVDDITFSIPSEEGVYKRIPEVLDCWFESGSMPYAQLHYPFENQDLFEKGFPSEFIAEGLDQTRGWFYTLTILSSALFDKPAFKNVIVNGLVLAEDGKKMSKRLRNYTPPQDLMETFGADALRLYLINSGLVRAEEQRFSDAGVKDMVRRALLPWYNSFKFFQTYAQIDGWNPKNHLNFGDNITDRWLLSKLQTLKKNIEKEMEVYHLYNVVPALFVFIEDLTNWYIRLNRRRFWGEGLGKDKCSAYSTLYTAVLELSTALAPFAPFLSEHIYLELQKLGGLEGESVHLKDYPLANESFINPLLEDAVDRMQQIILLGRQKRNQVQVKVKTPLKKLTIIHKDQALLDEIKKLENYIQTELNVKEIEYSTKEDMFIKLYAKPNSPVLGKRLGKQFGLFTKKISSLTALELNELETKGKLIIDEEVFLPDDILVFREPKEGTQALSNRFISIDMDCQLSNELIKEGLAREVVNRIQKTRKEMGFNVDDRINVGYQACEELSLAIKEHSSYIMKETLCDILTSKPLKNSINFEIDDYKLDVEIIRS